VTATVVLIIVGITLAELGRRLTSKRTLGLDTILLICVPSYLVYIHWIPTEALSQARKLFETTDAIEMFITIVILGSMLSIDRRALIAGLAKIFVPLCAASIAAAAVGTLVGAVLGLKAVDALFRVVAPIMGGGLTAGALPLSIGYARYLGTAQGEALALIVPAVILGNLAAIVFAGLMGFTEQRRIRNHPELMLVSRRLINATQETFGAPAGRRNPSKQVWVLAAAAIIFVIYLAGSLSSSFFGWSAPLVVLGIAAVLQLTHILPSPLHRGVLTLYRFCVAALTYPLLFAVGLLLTPWGTLLEGFSPGNIAIVIAVVGTLAISGYFTSRWCGLDAADGAILTVTRAAMGGTGDVAILSAAHRYELMPFAQIGTRIGGAATVATALLLMERL
jgi:malate:Na+ symporter